MDPRAYQTIGGEAKEHNPNAFITPMAEAENRMSDVLSRLGRVTEQLCGSIPEAGVATGQQLRGVPNGLFESAATHGQNISDMLERANQFLSRIERALP